MQWWFTVACNHWACPWWLGESETLSAGTAVTNWSDLCGRDTLMHTNLFMRQALIFVSPGDTPTHPFKPSLLFNERGWTQLCRQLWSQKGVVPHAELCVMSEEVRTVENLNYILLQGVFFKLQQTLNLQYDSKTVYPFSHTHTNTQTKLGFNRCRNRTS